MVEMGNKLWMCLSFGARLLQSPESQLLPMCQKTRRSVGTRLCGLGFTATLPGSMTFCPSKHHQTSHQRARRFLLPRRGLLQCAVTPDSHRAGQRTSMARSLGVWGRMATSRTSGTVNPRATKPYWTSSAWQDLGATHRQGTLIWESQISDPEGGPLAPEIV